MRDVYPYGLLSVDLKEIVEIHTSSGTTGKPVVDAYTAGDIEVWAEAMARTLSAGGTNRHDIVQNAYGYGLFTGGLGVHYGARKIGATVIPISGGNTRRQLAILQDFKSTVLTCTPSYSLYLAEAAREEGIDSARWASRPAFSARSPGARACDGDRGEALAALHRHLRPHRDHRPGGGLRMRAPEGPAHQRGPLLSRRSSTRPRGAALPDGAKGELVITTLTKEGTPVLRYRTRDITYLDHSPCPCGRTTVRMHRVLGRTDDMLIIRGVNVFPTQIEEVILRVEGIEPHYQLIVERRDQLDELEVQVEMNEKVFSDEIKNLERMEKKIEADLYASLNIHTRVRLMEPKSIARSEGKASGSSTRQI